MVYTNINKIKQKHIIHGLKLKRKTVRVIKFINDLIWKFENWLLFKKLKKKGWISKIKFFILFIIIRISISVTK